MKKATRILALVIVLLFLMAAVSACGDNGNNQGASNQEANTQDSGNQGSDAQSDTGDANSSDGPTEIIYYRIGIGYEPSTDPVI